MTEPAADLVITGCTALVHDEQEAPGFLEDATIVVRDGIIESVTAGGAADRGAGERIDAPGQVAMPGLINCHTHSPMVTLRGVAEDVATDEWFNDYVQPDRELLTIDVKAVVAAMGERMPAILDRSHGKRIQDCTT